MTTYTFQPTTPGQSVDWSDDAVWVGGIFPNELNADVVIPQVTSSYGAPDESFITIGSTESYSVNSLALMSDYLTINGALSIASSFTIQPGGELDIGGGTVTAGTVINDSEYDLQGAGQITTTGLLTNDALILGGGLTLTLGGLDNTNGTLEASSGDLAVQAPSGFVNISGGTLTGGAYTAQSGVFAPRRR